MESKWLGTHAFISGDPRVNGTQCGHAKYRLVPYAGQFGNGLQDHGFKVNLNWAF